MRKPGKLTVTLSVGLLAGFAACADPDPEYGLEVVPASTVKFQALNPARGDASPKAGVLWGDIRQDVASGAIIEFVDGFASPPHIHNVTYRGVVISGQVHNDDPSAARQWLGPGSFWTQPAGEPHITAAREGGIARIFLEIESGPYQVLPLAEAFDNGERPVNIDARNLVWLDVAELAWYENADQPADAVQPEISFLWGAPQSHTRNGALLRLPAGFAAELQGEESGLRTVVIAGVLEQQAADEGRGRALGPGSYAGASDRDPIRLTCSNTERCVVYVSATGRYRVKAL